MDVIQALHRWVGYLWLSPELYLRGVLLELDASIAHERTHSEYHNGRRLFGWTLSTKHDRELISTYSYSRSERREDTMA